MGGAWPPAHAHGAGVATPGFLPLTLMWVGMMAAMMAPTVWPWVAAFHHLADGAVARVRSTAAFTAGYFSAWCVYAAAAASAQLAFQAAGALDPVRGLAGPAGTAVLLGAGLYQFAPLKRACLTHCRSPFSYFLSRWRNGPAGGFSLGLIHGFFCVGCCWAPMATSLAVGMTSLWWMAALGVAAFVEQVVPYGEKTRIPIGVMLIAAALLRHG